MNKKPRIAIVLPGIQYGGGVPTMATFLYQQLLQDDHYQPTLISLAMSSHDEHSVRLLSPKSWLRGVQVRQGESNGLPVTFVGAFLAELEWQRYQYRKVLASLLAEYDLIQVVAGTALLTKAVYPTNIPVCLYVATTVEQDNESYRAQLRGWRAIWTALMTYNNKHIEQKILPQIDRVFAISHYTYNQLKAAVTFPNLILAPPGTDIKVFTPANTYQSNGYLLAVGRLADPRKNCRMLLHIYHQLRQHCVQPPRLRLVGQAPAAADWVLAEEWGITPYIDVFPYVSSKQELAEHYRQASLFLLTSDEEGLGIVVVEAMACGLPVIATRCGGPETTVVEGDTGYLVPVGNIEAFSTRIEQMWKQPKLRQQMGKRGRNRAVAHFSLAATGRIFLSHYKDMLQAN